MPRSLAAAGAPAPGQPFRMTGAGAVRFGAEETGSDGKPKLGTFNGIGYTGAVMTPGGWLGRIVCDLAGIKFPADKHRPIYHQHDSQQLVGHSSDLAIGPGGLEVAGVFSGQAEHVRKVTEPARNGFRWQMSIGATPIRTSWLDDGQTAEVNGRTVTGPLTISHETELGEVSFVPLGADGSTSVAVSASKGGPLMFAKVQLKFAKRQGYKAAAKFSDEEIEKMSEEEAKAALAKCQEEPKPKAKAADDDEGKKA
ncbi:MAG: hypothetical protein J0H57_19580, partial [Rhodospirillales bacterium]|nr:hypothetical protein [Rhodospirillales bacterium]